MARGLSRQDEVSLQGRLWTPNNLNPRPLAWHSIHDYSTLGFTTPTHSVPRANSWKNLSGSAMNATGSADVIYAPNGTPVLFTGTATNGGYLSYSGVNLPTYLSAVTMVSVVTHTLQFEYAFGWGKYYINTGTSSQPIISCGGSINGAQATTTVNPNGRISVFSAADGSAPPASFWVDGTLVASGTCAKQNGSATSTVSIGDNSVSGGSVNLFHSCMVFNRLITQSERQMIEGWSAWTFGLVDTLPAFHPFKNRAPTIGG